MPKITSSSSLTEKRLKQTQNYANLAGLIQKNKSSTTNNKKSSKRRNNVSLKGRKHESLLQDVQSSLSAIHDVFNTESQRLKKEQAQKELEIQNHLKRAKELQKEAEAHKLAGQMESALISLQNL